ncbi:MAG: sigma-70 family RNA polymerase sigma factor [Candidatus Dormiibacterota bacterium]
MPADATYDHHGPAHVPGPGISLTLGGRSDEETRRWVDQLRGTGPAHDETLSRLHELLLRVGRTELARRRGRYPITGPELEDLAQQAADDALFAILAKLSGFRGESRFTTWAYRFVILEVSAKLGRHFWQRPGVSMDFGDWERLPDRFGVAPEDHAQQRELIDQVRRAVSERLTEHQRQVFVAIVVDDVPLDALATRIGSNRNALYKTMFDARRKLRAALVESGYLSATATTGEPKQAPRGSNHERID